MVPIKLASTTCGTSVYPQEGLLSITPSSHAAMTRAVTLAFGNALFDHWQRSPRPQADIHSTSGYPRHGHVIVESIAWESGLNHDQYPPLKGVGCETEKVAVYPNHSRDWDQRSQRHILGPRRPGSPSTRSNHALHNVLLLTPVGPEP